MQYLLSFVIQMTLVKHDFVLLCTRGPAGPGAKAEPDPNQPVNVASRSFVPRPPNPPLGPSGQSRPPNLAKVELVNTSLLLDYYPDLDTVKRSRVLAPLILTPGQTYIIRMAD